HNSALTDGTVSCKISFSLTAHAFGWEPTLAERQKSPGHDVARWVPGLAAARSYRRGWLSGDLVAGIVLVAMLVPQGIAYSELAGLPPVHGLYATMIPLIVYAILGPSRILVLGPDSAVAPVVAAAIIPIAGADPSDRIALAGMAAILVGLFCLVGGLAGLGFVADLLSRPVRTGYLAGIAATVIASQVPSLLGFSVEGDGFFDNLQALVRGIDETDAATAAVGVGALAAILMLRQVNPRIPSALVVVILGTLANVWLDLALDSVGSLPEGLPGLALPGVDLDALGSLVLPALAIALIAFADTTVLSRSYAARAGVEVDQNQELRALGGANLLTGVFQGFPISSSSSRTPVAEAAGARTQLTGLVSAAGLAAVLVFGSEMFVDLPTAVLAAIVIAAVIGLIEVEVFRRLWRVYRPDFGLAIISLIGVAVFGVLQGVLVAVGLSIMAFLWRAWHPYDAVLGRADGVKGYHDITRYTQARQVPGLVLFRFDGPLFFANAGVFRTRLLAAVHQGEPPVHRVVVAAEPITSLDSTAADMLGALEEELDAQHIQLAFAEMKDPVKDGLERFGLHHDIGKERFYPTMGVAVKQFVEEYDIDWVDWEDQPGGAPATQDFERQPV
ncbi:MAG TPA: sulfate permease, partial [Thermomicrobiales bacterium]|nr:sulfate permease [Thermomicrobiales bacterium]